MKNTKTGLRLGMVGIRKIKWLSVDPMHSERSWLTPYNYVQNNPVNLIDPTGMIDWKPEVLEDGSVLYQPEKGDNAETLASQYGLTLDQANSILCNGNVGTITGSDVRNVMGTDVLALDLTSDVVTSDNINIQAAFMIENESINGKGYRDINKYFLNFNSKSSRTAGGFQFGVDTNGDAPTEIRFEGQKIKASVSIRAQANDGIFETTYTSRNLENGVSYDFKSPKQLSKGNTRIPVITIRKHGFF